MLGRVVKINLEQKKNNEGKQAATANIARKSRADALEHLTIEPQITRSGTEMHQAAQEWTSQPEDLLRCSPRQYKLPLGSLCGSCASI
jgi:hypothetical protein